MGTESSCGKKSKQVDGLYSGIVNKAEFWGKSYCNCHCFPAVYLKKSALLDIHNWKLNK